MRAACLYSLLLLCSRWVTIISSSLLDRRGGRQRDKDAGQGNKLSGRAAEAPNFSTSQSCQQQSEASAFLVSLFGICVSSQWPCFCSKVSIKLFAKTKRRRGAEGYSSAVGHSPSMSEAQDLNPSREKKEGAESLVTLPYGWLPCFICSLPWRDTTCN